MWAATAFVGFVVLAMVCVACFGPFGAVIWLTIYGLFHALCRAILRHVGEEADIYATHPHLTATSTPASANTPPLPPSHTARSFSRPQPPNSRRP